MAYLLIEHNLATGKVGARRTAKLCFPTPLRTGRATFTAPGSPGIGFPHVSAVIGFLSSKRLISRATPRIPKVISDYFVRRMSIPWPPSPCTRLSRAPTTMGPPTLAYFIDGLLISICEPPTFTKMHSARSFRWQFASDPSRSLRNPDREQGKPDDLFLPLSWLLCLTSLGPPFGYGRCPVSARVPISRLCKILRGRGKVSRRSNPASRALTMRSLSQARHLGGLHRTAPDRTF
jgi:hypothetical protein